MQLLGQVGTTVLRHDGTAATFHLAGAVEGMGAEVVPQDRDARAPDVADRLAVVLDLLLAAGLAKADLHPELVRGVLERLDPKAVAFDPLPKADQIVVFPALVTGQAGRGRQDDAVAAKLFGKDQVLVGHVAWQSNRDPDAVGHGPSPSRRNRAR